MLDLSSIWIGFLFLGLNIIFWLCLYVVQNIESRLGWIPKRVSAPSGSKNSFPYLQDYNRCTWGDAIGLSIIDWVVGYEYATLHPSALLIGGSMVLGLFATALFLLSEILVKRLNFSISRHNHLSVTGYVHMLYFFMNASFFALLAILSVTTRIDPLLLTLAVIGSVMYLSSFCMDLWHHMI